MMFDSVPPLGLMSIVPITTLIATLFAVLIVALGVQSLRLHRARTRLRSWQADDEGAKTQNRAAPAAESQTGNGPQAERPATQRPAPVRSSLLPAMPLAPLETVSFDAPRPEQRRPGVPLAPAAPDITGSTAPGDPLNASEDSIRTLFEALPLMLAMWRKADHDFVLDALNPASQAAAGLSQEIRPGVHASSLSQDMPWLLPALRQCHGEQSVIALDHRHPHRPPHGAGLWDARLTVTVIPVAFNRVLMMMEDKEALLRAETRLHDLAALVAEAEAMAGVGSWEWDLITGQWTVSDNWMQLQGVLAPPRSTDDVLDTIHPDDLDRVRSAIRMVLERGQPYQIVVRVIHKRSGDIRTLKTRLTLRHDADGRPLHMRGVAVDVTESTRTGQRLREITDLMIAGQRMARMASSEYDIKTETWTVSEPWLDLFGARHAPTRTEDILATIHPDDRDRVLRELSEGMTGTGNRTEHRAINGRTGRVMDIRGIGALVRDSDGTPLRFQAILQDVTEEKQRERAMANSLLDLRMAQRIANTGSWTYTPDTEEFAWSEQTYAIYGRDRRLGPPHPDDYKGYYREAEFGVFCNRFTAAVRDGRPYDLTAKVHRSDGTVVWVHVIAEPEDTPGPAGYVVHGTVQDITEQKRAEEFREDIERIIRHDLKSPMVAVCSGIDLLRLGPNLTDDQRQTLDLMDRSTRRQLLLLKTSMALYHMERGTYVLQPEPVSLRAVIDEIATELKLLFTVRKATLTIEGPKTGDPDITVMGEPLLCHALLANLIRNAVEALPDKGLSVTITLLAEADKGVVRLTNPGSVPTEIRHTFFEKYTTSGKSEGTGLGTYSARLMAKAQGGTVTLDCRQPGLTTVTVSLPLTHEVISIEKT